MPSSRSHPSAQLNQPLHPLSQNDEARKRKNTTKDKGIRKHIKLDENSDSFVEYKDFARWIIRSEHLLISWYTVLDVGLKADAEEYNENNQFMKQYQIELDIYHRLHKKCPRFAYDIKKMKKKAKYEKEIISILRNASRGACSDDSNSLLSDGLEYINAKYQPLEPPVPARQPKADVRGFNHPMIARLLCPIDYLESFDNNPESFCHELLNGSIKVHSTDFPLCLYDEELIDSDDPSAGLMRSKVLVAFFKHIFIGPSTALKDGSNGSKAKRGQAQKNNMKKPTAGSIAYAATQLRWCLSASDDWRLGDGNWSPESFYGAIMRAFGINVDHDENGEGGGEGDDEDDDEEAGEWAKETIAWFTKQVFMDKSASESATPIRGSTLDTLLAKRKAKNSARKAAAAQHLPPAHPDDHLEGSVTESETEPE